MKSDSLNNSGLYFRFPKVSSDSKNFESDSNLDFKKKCWISFWIPTVSVLDSKDSFEDSISDSKKRLDSILDSKKGVFDFQFGIQKKCSLPKKCAGFQFGFCRQMVISTTLLIPPLNGGAGVGTYHKSDDILYPERSQVNRFVK